MGKGNGWKRKGEGKKIYIYKKKKQKRVCRWHNLAGLGVLGCRTGEQLCCSQGKGGEGGLEIRGRGEEKDLSEIFKGFFVCLWEPLAAWPAADSILGVQGDPATVPALGAAGTVTLPGCFRSLNQERHRQPGTAAGAKAGSREQGRCVVIPPAQGCGVPQPLQSACSRGHPAHGVLPAHRAALQPLLSHFVLITPKDTIKGAGGDGKRPAKPRHSPPSHCGEEGKGAQLNRRMLRSPGV